MNARDAKHFRMAKVWPLRWRKPGRPCADIGTNLERWGPAIEQPRDGVAMAAVRLQCAVRDWLNYRFGYRAGQGDNVCGGADTYVQLDRVPLGIWQRPCVLLRAAVETAAEIQGRSVRDTWHRFRQVRHDHEHNPANAGMPCSCVACCALQLIDALAGSDGAAC